MTLALRPVPVARRRRVSTTTVSPEDLEQLRETRDAIRDAFFRWRLARARYHRANAEWKAAGPWPYRQGGGLDSHALGAVRTQEWRGWDLLSSSLSSQAIDLRSEVKDLVAQYRRLLVRIGRTAAR